ncbi:phosphatase PAP2 family protein [Anaerofustis butyriciformans]|uniref:phosphatase PAP2 family protein n=1 Tax=Anaerofustis butyriciformans TaxID=3108533 RepID=UPI002E3077BE|nr:phosphatase PAP2 family protein [Anaerofustis sp. HA2171]
MDKNFYLKLYEPYKKDLAKKRRLNILDKIVTYSVFISFPVFLIIGFLMGKDFVLRLVLTTFIPFVLLSFFRKLFNFKRPYEVFNITPVLDKDTKGKSFPSRHVFSAFLIASSCLFVNYYYGIFVLILGVLLMYIRVVGGVHFLRDVLFGMGLGILCGVIGMTINIPFLH